MSVKKREIGAKSCEEISFYILFYEQYTQGVNLGDVLWHLIRLSGPVEFLITLRGHTFIVRDVRCD